LYANARNAREQAVALPAEVGATVPRTVQPFPIWTVISYLYKVVSL